MSIIPPLVPAREVRQLKSPFKPIPIPHQSVAIERPVVKRAPDERGLVALRRDTVYLACRDRAIVVFGDGHDVPR